MWRGRVLGAYLTPETDQAVIKQHEISAGSTSAGSTGAGSTGAGSTGAGSTGAGSTSAGSAGSTERWATERWVTERWVTLGNWSASSTKSYLTDGTAQPPARQLGEAGLDRAVPGPIISHCL
jgi:hypothetical protein